MTSKYDLIKEAQAAMSKAYAPYSQFRVGAAVLTSSNKIFTGCNVENASFGGCICAERVALVKAVSEGERHFKAIAVVTSDNNLTFPCGICRQFLSEFSLDITFISGNDSEIREYTLNELLPHAFTSFNNN